MLLILVMSTFYTSQWRRFEQIRKISEKEMVQFKAWLAIDYAKFLSNSNMLDKARVKKLCGSHACRRFSSAGCWMKSRRRRNSRRWNHGRGIGCIKVSKTFGVRAHRFHEVIVFRSGRGLELCSPTDPGTPCTGIRTWQGWISPTLFFRVET